MNLHTEQAGVQEQSVLGADVRGNADPIWPEEQRQRLLAALSRTEPAWKDEDHPELAELGTYGWVRSLREKGWRSPEVESPATEQQ